MGFSVITKKETIMQLAVFYITICFISVLVSIACTLPGIFLVLRGIALMSDAISHSMLFGIVIGFLCIHRLHSPFMFYGALGSAFLTVIATEQIIKTKILKKDAAIGLVFPLFFSVAVLLITQFARSVHLDTDMVLSGEILLAPLQTYTLFGISLGTKAIWQLAVIIIGNSTVLYLLFRHFKTSTFDATFAHLVGYNNNALHYVLLFLVSCTTIVAFDIVGAVMSVALTIIPAATAYLWTKNIKTLVFLALCFASLAACIGSILGIYFDLSIAGMIATVCGILFYFSVFFTTYRTYA
jgi:manganese/zinc/iron transport system permease protein